MQGFHIPAAPPLYTVHCLMDEYANISLPKDTFLSALATMRSRAIGPGIMILLGVRDTDTLDIVPKLADKCAGLRIFPDAEGKLNLSARDLGYSALVVSQFTLYGDTRKGYRPSFIKAAKPPLSVDAYELFLAEMAKHGLKDVQHGEFGAHMQVSLVNEGPCTIIIDTDEWKKKE